MTSPETTSIPSTQPDVKDLLPTIATSEDWAFDIDGKSGQLVVYYGYGAEQVNLPVTIDIVNDLLVKAKEDDVNAMACLNEIAINLNIRPADIPIAIKDQATLDAQALDNSINMALGHYSNTKPASLMHGQIRQVRELIQLHPGKPIADIVCDYVYGGYRADGGVGWADIADEYY